ncbi:MAG: DUF1349 domain-containing protein [Gaiellaceae bacterium]
MESAHVRIEPLLAFHASTDGSLWRMIRHFSLGAGDGIPVGLEAQSQTGDGCAVRFEQIRCEARALGDLRGGE